MIFKCKDRNPVGNLVRMVPTNKEVLSLCGL